MRRAAKVDASQSEIVDALRKYGATVQSLAKVGDGCPDLLVGYRKKNFLMEVKEPKVKGKLRPSQKDWHEGWNGDYVYVVKDTQSALLVLDECT